MELLLKSTDSLKALKKKNLTKDLETAVKDFGKDSSQAKKAQKALDEA